MKKISSKKGETIAETLISVLIVTMALTILAGAIVSAARINSRIKNEEVAFAKEETPEGYIDKSVVFSMTGVSIQPVDVKVYSSGNDTGYYYYDKK
ncbi:MAG: hypothetical protein K6B14_02840 [Lachnospiraceae bacterium]|nr:hypothetical protein [Lachnospiraceae bacterium]